MIFYITVTQMAIYRNRTQIILIFLIIIFDQAYQENQPAKLNKTAAQYAKIQQLTSLVRGST
ncbi:MAG: hypothetical protein CL608_30235 [Anaerolineaceae bacterium]|nr:hypothetical protein [Anaerolineaceae bacterium]